MYRLGNPNNGGNDGAWNVNVNNSLGNANTNIGGRQKAELLFYITMQASDRMKRSMAILQSSLGSVGEEANRSAVIL